MAPMVMTVPDSESFVLPLREDLQLLPGPVAEDGSPSWSLHDRVRNTFFRIGWLEFELLARWSTAKSNLVTVGDLVSRVNDETTLHTDEEEVLSLQQFLLLNCLLEAGSPEVQALLQARMTKKKKFLTWLLHNYLFIRIPLLQPDRFLSSTLPMARFLVSRIFLTFLALGALAGIYMVTRQWQTFIHTFPSFFTARGFLLYAVTLILVKVVHELGHAYTAKYYGVKVPTMGVAFLVLWPILYSDTTESWKLTNRNHRLSIVAAGALSELLLAVVATFLWNFLPDSPLRSACFIVATVSWVTSVLWNLNPFMRFDGYFLLSDYLDIPNLQDRSFDLGKWHLRKLLLGIRQEIPEDFGADRNLFLIAYAYGVWIYRVFLFTGIALTVYHFFFKVLGIFLFLVEICWFIALPVLREMGVWWQQRRSIGSCRHNIIVSMLFFSGIVAFVVVPRHAKVEMPALFKAEAYWQIYTPFSGRIEEIHATEGQDVKKGDLLFSLSNPEIDYLEKQSVTLCQDLENRIKQQSTGRELLESQKILENQLAECLTELSAHRKQKKRLQVRARMDGTLQDVVKGLRVGLWLDSRQLLGLLVDRSRFIVEAYVDESHLGSIEVGNEGRFFPENKDSGPMKCRVAQIDPTATVYLQEPYLASTYGGEIGVQISREEKRMKTHKSLYRLTLRPSAPDRPDQVVRGKVVLKGGERSLLASAWKRVVAVFIRESGF
ncbi:MAG: efflux RND transporter periplasmic adaptor subunit [Desulfobulbaceae bacterium]|nr:efflux RND transporter periplasmic adaptor subunit [Desulfobulbaceae bacterium]